MNKKDLLPKFHELMNPLIQALHDLGGSGSIDEIAQRVSEITDLPEDLLNILHNPEKSSLTEVEYRLAWARTYLKKYGLIDNSERGVWVIVAEKRNIKSIDPQDVVKRIKAQTKKEKQPINNESIPQDESDMEPPVEEESWRSILHNLLIHDLSSEAFERLTKRILRESGFTQVEVTGRSGDGGIDGIGILRLSGFLSFHVIFQCKKYRGQVTSSHIRDFRGAMIGRADKGLFITTGTFTRDAVREATRDGAPPIDLIDGDLLADKLKELGLGIKKELVEIITVDTEWFLSV